MEHEMSDNSWDDSSEIGEDSEVEEEDTTASEGESDNYLQEDDTTGSEEETDPLEGNSDLEDGFSDSDLPSEENEYQKTKEPKASKQPKQKQARSKQNIKTKGGTESDVTGRLEMDISDGDDSSKSCPICLLRFKEKQPIAVPGGGCSHTFCLECLREWSKNVATCPIDRSKFHYISVRDSVNGKELQREKVRQSRAQEEEEEPAGIDELWLCESCGSGGREDYLLLCDGCDLAYHYDTCLNPALTAVPRGRWFCPTCRSAGLGSSNRRNENRERRRQELENDIDENVPERRNQTRQRRAVIMSDSEDSEPSTLDRNPAVVSIRSHNVTARRDIVPRTLQSERVRRVVATRRGENVLPKKPLSSYFLFLQDERPKAKEELQSLNLPNNMVDVSKEVARRWAEARETTKAEYERRYRVAKIEYDKAMESIPISQRQSTAKKKVKRKVKKKSRKGKKTASSSKRKSAVKKNRTAGRNKKCKRGKYKRKRSGVTKNKGKYSKTKSKTPKAYNSTNKDQTEENSGIVVERLSLFGHKDELVYFEDDDKEENLLSRSSKKPVAVIKPFCDGTSRTSTETAATSSSTFLNDIMAGQQRLLKLEKKKVQKMGEVYSKQSETSSAKLISTTVSRSAYNIANTAKKSNDPSKIKSSTKFMDRFISKNNVNTVDNNEEVSKRAIQDNQSKCQEKLTEKKRKIDETETNNKKIKKEDDKSVGDIVNDIIDDIIDSPNRAENITRDNDTLTNITNKKDYKTFNNPIVPSTSCSSSQINTSSESIERSKLAIFKEPDKVNDRATPVPLATVTKERSSNHKSQHIYRNFVNTSDRKIIDSKGDNTKVGPMAKDNSYTAALESKMGDIKTQMSNPTKIGGQGTLFYQPNYMPSSGKGIPNNIQRSEISPTGIYKDKLDKQTQISQQVNYLL